MLKVCVDYGIDYGIYYTLCSETKKITEEMNIFKQEIG